MLNNVKILVTGAKGQLGSEIRQRAEARRGFQYTFVDVDEMDLTHEDSIHRFFEGKHFDFIIHCAAYTAVDRAEDEMAVAFRINADAPKTIATICLRKKIRLIHISTDYVFDGTGNQPIVEASLPNPLSVYGKSKLAGEQHVLNILRDAYVIRTAWVYSSFGKNFVKTIAKLGRERPSLSVVCDQFGSPTFAGDLGAAIISMVEQVARGDTDAPGIYHYTNEGAISWYDLAHFIVQHLKLPCKVIPITTEEYKTLAIRPTFTVLDKRKIKNTFGLEIPHWHDSLTRCLDTVRGDDFPVT